MTDTDRPTLVLWDIDLTLVDYSGVGPRWYADSLASVVGTPMQYVPTFPGRTERSITTELLAAHGINGDEEKIQRMFAALTAIAEQARPHLASLGRALPGAAEALASLAARSDVVQSLVTGNLAALAGYKLEPFGLDTHVDLEIGGYGAISVHRHDLVSSAIESAERKYGVRFPPSSVVVIGDTPHDVAAGSHHGTVTVGVATGRHSAAELADCGADVVLPDLVDTDAVLAALLPAARTNGH